MAEKFDNGGSLETLDENGTLETIESPESFEVLEDESEALNKEIAEIAKNKRVPEEFHDAVQEPPAEMPGFDRKTYEYTERVSAVESELERMKETLEGTFNEDDRQDLEIKINKLETKKANFEKQERIVSGIMGEEKSRMENEEIKQVSLHRAYAGVDERGEQYKARIAGIENELGTLRKNLKEAHDGMEKHEISEKIKGLEVKKKRTEAEFGVVYEKAGDIIEDIGEGKYSKKVQGEQKPIPSVARVMEKSEVRATTPQKIEKSKGFFGSIKSFFGFGKK